MNVCISISGNVCDSSMYEMDVEKKVFICLRPFLVVDFHNISGWRFEVSDQCIIKSGSDCTFSTGSDCTFYTGENCVFRTGNDCTFRTRKNCTFKTGSFCTFTVGVYSTFDCGNNCFCIRRDLEGVITIPSGKPIKLNGPSFGGYIHLDEKYNSTLSYLSALFSSLGSPTEAIDITSTDHTDFATILHTLIGMEQGQDGFSAVSMFLHLYHTNKNKLNMYCENNDVYALFTKTFLKYINY